MRVSREEYSKLRELGYKFKHVRETLDGSCDVVVKGVKMLKVRDTSNYWTQLREEKEC